MGVGVLIDRRREWPVRQDRQRAAGRGEAGEEIADARNRRHRVDERRGVRGEDDLDLGGIGVLGGYRLVPLAIKGRWWHPAKPRKHPDEPFRDVDLTEPGNGTSSPNSGHVDVFVNDTRTAQSSVNTIVGSPQCMHAHVGFLARGHVSGEYADHCAFDFIAPRVIVIEPGHDAWVVGDEPCVVVDFGGYAQYAKG